MRNWKKYQKSKKRSEDEEDSETSYINDISKHYDDDDERVWDIYDKYYGNSRQGNSERKNWWGKNFGQASISPNIQKARVEQRKRVLQEKMKLDE